MLNRLAVRHGPDADAVLTVATLVDSPPRRVSEGLVHYGPCVRPLCPYRWGAKRNVAATGNS